MSGSSRILFVAHTGQVSGAEKVMLNLVDEALKRSHTVTVACPDGPLTAALPEAVTHLAIPPLGLSGERGLLWGIGATRLILRWLSAGRKLASIARDPQTSTVVNSTFALPAVRVARPARGASWLVHEVITTAKQHAAVGIGRPVVRIAVSVSEAAARPLRAAGLPVAVALNGTPWPVPRFGGELHSPPVVGMLAILTPWKGQRVLMEAAAKLPHVHVELAGSGFPGDTDYVAELHTRAAQPDLAGRVRFLGHVHPETALRRWDVVVSGSVSPEAMALSMLEAMAHGVPVVGTNHGGTAELLAGGAGVLVPPGDAAAMAQGIDALLIDANERREMCDRARHVIEEKYDLALTLPWQLNTLLS